MDGVRLLLKWRFGCVLPLFRGDSTLFFAMFVGVIPV